MEQTQLVECKPKRVPFFTKANAKLYAAKSHEMRRLATKLAQQPSQQPEQPSNDQPDPFHSRTLSRVRAQMSRLLSLAEKESDPAKLDRLAAAFAKHEEVERRLSDRSLPAVRRVQDTPKSKASQLFGE